ncbi:MAG: C4-dicarboxylate transporter DctA [Hyphomonadaceae bacterium]
MAAIDSAGASSVRKPFYHQLYFQVLMAIVLGGVIGHLYRGEPWIQDYLYPLGQGFVKLVKMIIAPVIFLTISIGIASMRDMGALGRVAGKAFGYFIVFSTFALIVGLVIGNVVQPGAGMNFDLSSISDGDLSRVQGYEARAHETTIQGFLLSVIPDTFFSALTGGNILQVLFVAILFGVSLAAIGDRARPVLSILDSASAAVFRMVGILMRAAPVGAFGAFAFIISSQGLGAIVQLGKLILTVYATSALFIIVVLGVVSAVAGFSIFKLLRYIWPELVLVLGTSSSESALPALMEKLERAGCAKPVVGVVVPAGYSFNLDGTNIYMTMAALFIAQATNIDLSLAEQLALLGVAMISSKGAAGVTGAGFITLVATLQVVPTIPVAGMAIILGVDRFLSECRALTNFIGNAVATIVVSRWEGALDRDKLNAALSGAVPPLAAEPIEVDED